MKIREGLTFDDVLLVPRHSKVLSRRDVNLATLLSRRMAMAIPIVSANMDTITALDMARAMTALGGVGILHRFAPVPEIVGWLTALGAAGNRFAAIGVTAEDLTVRLSAVVAAGAAGVCIDVAHGDHIRVVDATKSVKDRFPDLEVIAGNVATGDGAARLTAAGADAIKVGIGSGGLCSTRLQTGCGVPQLTAIMDTYDAVGGQVPIIADGGVRFFGDVTKALAAGASSVMIGGLFAGTLETPGEIVGGRKTYRGMASREAQQDWKGTVSGVEGESTTVPALGSVKDVVEEILCGLRSGMSYLNAATIPEIRQNAEFIRISSAGWAESRPHRLY